jgi:FdhE protein
MAERLGIPRERLATLAHFLAVPLLLEAARRAGPILPAGWPHGYCPACGAWPALAELRGLERRRVLRCGRCALGWERGVLHCAYCGERDHRRQGALVPDGEGERVRVETCLTCRGFLKVVTTLRGKAAWELLVDDLRTLPLDLAALDRGFERPEPPGWQLAVAVAAAAEDAR